MRISQIDNKIGVTWGPSQEAAWTEEMSKNKKKVKRSLPEMKAEVSCT